MTTPDDAPIPDSGPAPDEAPRITRPEPARTGPVRGAAKPLPSGAPDAGATPTDAEPIGSPPPPPPESDPVSQSVAHAVRTGYDVVAANIKEGRLAAKRFRQGEYNVRDAPRDLTVVTLRLVGLARDLSSTTFDIIEQLLKDPNLAGGGAAGRESAPSVRPAPVAPGFHPAPGPPAQPHASTATPPAAGSAPAGGAPLIPLTCAFTGPRPASVKAAMVSRPERPTHPDQLSLTPLAAVTPGARPIGGVTFSAAGGGAGLVARIPIPDDQPPGVYSGLIFAPGADAPLGFLSIEVAGEAAG